MSIRTFHSIRWSLQIWHGLLLILVLTGFGVTTWQVAWTEQLRRVDAELEQRLQAPFRPAPGMAGAPLPPAMPPPAMFRRPDPADGRRRVIAAIERMDSDGVYYALWDENGSLLARSPGAPAHLLHPEVQKFSSGPPPRRQFRTSGNAREAFQPLPFGETLLAGRSIAPEISVMRRLALILLAVGSGVLVLGLAGGSWLASRAIRPIRVISETASRIAAGDLSQRIDSSIAENELGRLAQVLNQTFTRLEVAFGHQARFTSDASHELRTPVSVILAQTQTVLARERSAAEYREALEACQRAADRMRKLTESLLALTRLDARQEVMKRERFDLGRVLRESTELIRPIADEKKVRLISDVVTLECEGDAERIAQVATNLLSNAVQFNHQGGEIHIASRRENGFASFSVTDTGEGIPAEDVPQIFERFYRVDKARSRSRGRTGLGLAICKSIVDAHHGVIDVKTELGRGSTFTVKLPVKELPRSARHPAADTATWQA